ncbi:inositol monophosphatase family protein [Curvivirga aplysinae]|uniref:inositol monophosphatase family protein n=1 Tax=Curvivirga aplysinae TaxID=2529852 RepID=UPI0012BBADD3|nr:inositol monophosphatase [Curvivirga aplysinae]MTI10058.1 inositol monophosphatase [Curvivirga aplysinae]
MAMPEFSADRLGPHLRQLAEEIMLPKFKTLSDEEKRQKTPGDYVTVVDIEMEKRLDALLPKLVEGSVVIGEEAVSTNPKLLKEAYKEDLVWLVDPLDGTNNFANGDENFCVMVALHYKGEAVISCIYDPLKKKTVTAEKGQGAYRESHKLTCNPNVSFDQMTGQINFRIIQDVSHREYLKKDSQKRFKNVKRLGCAGQDFIMHTEDVRHFSLYSRLAPWDFAAGGLILKEAGGKLAKIDDSEMHAFEYAHGLLTSVHENNWVDLRNYFLNQKI